MPLSTQPYKGARDFYPEDKRKQDYMFNVIRSAVTKYGYQEYDAPILEPYELYKAKTGDEIVNEQTYLFTDRGGREVVIRPEMTPTVSRMVAARRQELAYPLRWFSIPNLWRYERPQRGRLREHWQLNVDLFGEAGIAADHEIISVADSILKAFGAKESMYQIKINNRSLVNELLTNYLKLDANRSPDLIKLIDRMHKISQQQLSDEINKICEGMLGDIESKVNAVLSITSLDELPEEVATSPHADSIRQLLKLLESTDINNAVFDITLMRGFDYYTDIVFEVFDTDPENNRSMFGGGRYNGLVGLFGVEPVPTVGFGMGDVTLANFLDVHKLMPNLTVNTDLLIVTVGDVYEDVSKLATELREMGLSVSIDATQRKLDKKIKHADKQGIRHLLFVGENELKEEQYPLKDIITGTEEKHSTQRIVSIIKDYRR